MIRESLLAQIWRHQWIIKDALTTVDGQRVLVLHPGWENSHDSGPDFRHAIIGMNGGSPVTGDVELHLRSQEWEAHGHHKDPNYDSVVLHVVLWDGGREASSLNNGKKAPILALSPYLRGPLEELRWAMQPSFLSCACSEAFQRHGQAWVEGVLVKAGKERFHLKAWRFKKRMAETEIDQVLHEGLMRALGYAKNKRPFERLAQLLPLDVLVETDGLRSLVEIQAMMLGTAGLLPKQRCGKHMGLSGSDKLEAERLQQVWYSCGVGQAMKESDWRFFKVRPENLPPRRIVAASYLLSRHGPVLLESVLDMVEQAHPQTQKKLEQMFMIPGDGYWVSHCDFGRELGSERSLIGQGRAREMVVNVLLPCLLAWAVKCHQSWLKGQVLELYRDYPGLPENWVTRRMQKQIFGLERMKVNSACQQQGLIHLYETFCLKCRCQVCPLGWDGASGHRQPSSAGDLFDTEVTQEVK
ncbi:MAG: DUF2851 family protein [Chloroflexi bacterium]|nr:DUF2851 family protein [Chloroflexota bacterium]